MEDKEINPIDKEERDKIIKTEGNICVLASAGSGKTSILVKKLEFDIKKEKNHYNFVAITFTNKAATELRDKIVKKERVFIGTIDSFLEKEIIDIFIKSIEDNIPEKFYYSYQKKDKFCNYNDGLKKLKEYKIFGTYDNDIQKLGKNFKCELALKLLKKSVRVQEYLKYKYKKIFIDEYQDSDQGMHELFCYFAKELGIKLFIVGDDKQSIYGWRGAKVQNFKNIVENNIEKISFNIFRLHHNFRSHINITLFSQILSEKNIEKIEKTNEKVIFYKKSTGNKKEDIQDIIKRQKIDLKKSILVLIGNNEDIKSISSELIEIDSDFKVIKRDILNDCPNFFLLEQIAKYYFDKDYSEYDFMNTFLFREYTQKEVSEIGEKLRKLSEKLDLQIIQEIFEYFDIEIQTVENNKKIVKENEILLEVLSNDSNKIFYIKESKKPKHIMTTHSSKGLEYDQVIIFCDYYINRYSKKLKIEENYVGITRAKEKLFLIEEDKANTYKNIVEKKMQEKEYKFEDFIECL